MFQTRTVPGRWEGDLLMGTRDLFEREGGSGRSCHNSDAADI